MDTGKGKLEMLEVPSEGGDAKEAEGRLRAAMKALEEAHPNHGGWFRVGDVIVIKGSRFRVKGVKPTELRLKLLPKDHGQ